MAKGNDAVQPGVRQQLRSSHITGRTEKVASRVARDIVRDIAQRGLTPGTPLDLESQMLDHYGVSRASLREALRILEVHGLLTIRPGPGGGPFVAGADSVDFGRMSTLFFQVMGVTLGAVLEARLILEPVMAALAAERKDQQLNDELLEIIEAHRDVQTQDGEWLAVTARFHATVCRMSGNPLLDLLASSLKDIYTARVAGLAFPSDDRAKVIETHEQIARAIAEGDSATAQQIMLDHMRTLAANAAERNPGIMDEIIDWG